MATSSLAETDREHDHAAVRGALSCAARAIRRPPRRADRLRRDVPGGVRGDPMDLARRSVTVDRAGRRRTDAPVVRQPQQVSTYGRVPLFFYLIHIPLIHLIAVIYSYLASAPPPG